MFWGLAAVGSEEVVGGKNVKREAAAIAHRTAFDSRCEVVTTNVLRNLMSCRRPIRNPKFKSAVLCS